MAIKKRLIFCIIVLGFSSMSSQILLMRELLIIFYGNELSLGLTLASWLFWIGFGSLVIGRNFAARFKNNPAVFAGCEIILAFLLPLNILIIRSLPSILNFSPGEIIDICSMAISTFLLLAPLCALSGFIFVLGCEIFPVELQGARRIGYVYILEAGGSTFGGLITSIFLIRFFTALHIMTIIAILNITSAILLFWPRRKIFYAGAIFLLAFISFIFSGGLDILQSYSVGRQWLSYELLASRNSIYGNIAVARRENLYSVFTNGVYNFSVPDELTAEKNAHFPMLEHPAPEDILIIGGGAGGMLNEVLKYPLKHADYVELDPLIINMAKQYLPENKAWEDPRIKIISNMDGRLFVKKTDRKYDVIIMNIPGPHTTQLNRLYTKEFFLEAKNILKQEGILCFSLPSNPDYISFEQAELYICLKKTLESAFEEVEITPGDVSYFLASNKRGLISLDWKKLMDRLNRRKIDAKYMREYYLFTELSEERIEYMRNSLHRADALSPGGKSGGRDIINRDFHPVACYYDMALWSTHFKPNFKRFFQAVTPRKIYITAFLICLILILPIFTPIGMPCMHKRKPAWGILTCVGTTGFAEMSFQIITLLAYQAIYGYVFYKLGIVMTSYMAGLIFGGWYITKRLDRAGYEFFTKTQIAICIYPLLLPFLFWLLSMGKSRFSFWLGSNFFPFLPIIAGFIGGVQFPLANSLYMKRGAGAGVSSGLTYGLDIFGACAGAILTAVILVPIIGIQMSCILTAGLNFTGLILVLKIFLKDSS